MGSVALALGFMLAVTAACVTAVRYANDPLWREARRVKQRHRGMATSKIAELPESESGRIVGRVAVLERSLIAPLSGRPCVYYAVIVNELERWGWRDLISERREVTFAIEDRSGRAVINPVGASVALSFDWAKHVDGWDALTQEQESLLTRHGFLREGFLRPRTLRFYVGVIPIGHHVEVVGAGVREPDPTAHAASSYREAPTQLSIRHVPAAPLSIDSALSD
jgi:hypothetical protein